MSLLSVEDLHVRHSVPGGELRAVEGVSLAVDAGETVGLVGESGCGKSSLGKAILHLLPVADGTIRFGGADITHLTGRSLQPFRRRIQMVFQDPYASLNPRQTVFDALARPLLVHGVRTRAARRRSVEALMQSVSLSPEMLARYPNEFSGGQRQRIAIARAMVLQPELMVLDEPVSALDVSVQAQILNLLMDLKRDRGLAYVFISHDLSVVRYVADRIYVMYLGRIVEVADQHSLWTSPRHHYTRALIDAVPKQRAQPRCSEMSDAIGSVSAVTPPSGCRFHPRCRAATDLCRTAVPLLQSLSATHQVACHHPLS
jgi:oligopeptide/dipeptide ABC transporter ATP-binding protein